MLSSKLFSTDRYQQVERKLIDLLNNEPDYLSVRTAKSPRAAGDAIQELVADHIEDLLGPDCLRYSKDMSRRAMADLAFYDAAGCYYRVDVKTHRLDTAFNMPNLTSVRRLADFYEDDNNYFVILMVKYEVNQSSVLVKEVHFVPIELLSWQCLTLGALGWGQIQIANANQIVGNQGRSRKNWMLEMFDLLLDFYPQEISKINLRIAHFEALKREWMSKLET